MSRFAPCSSCARHVRADSDACPFCGATFDAPEGGPAPTGRLGRAALFAFGTAVAASVSLSGCGETTVPGDGGSAVADAGVDAGGPAPAYGTPPPEDAGLAPMYGAPPEDAGGPAPLYGGAP